MHLMDNMTSSTYKHEENMLSMVPPVLFRLNVCNNTAAVKIISSDLGLLPWTDPAGAGGDPGRPVCRQPPSAAGTPQPLLPLPHPGTHTHTHTKKGLFHSGTVNRLNPVCGECQGNLQMI